MYEGRPRPTVRLTGVDGDSFTILALCRRAAKDAGWTMAEVAAWTDRAMGGNYGDLLAAVEQHFEIETEATG